MKRRDLLQKAAALTAAGRAGAGPPAVPFASPYMTVVAALLLVIHAVEIGVLHLRRLSA